MTKIDTSMTNDKDAGLALILILLIITIMTNNSLFLIPTALLLVVAMTVPVIFRPFSIIWFGLSAALGRCSSMIILTILFIVLVVPIAYLRRMSGSDTLQLKRWKESTESAFSIKEHRYQSTDMERPF